MLVQYDPDVGATYVVLSETPCARTVEVSDLVAVDVDEHGDPVGVEFAVAVHQITESMIAGVVSVFPELKAVIGDSREWMPQLSY